MKYLLPLALVAAGLTGCRTPTPKNPDMRPLPKPEAALAKLREGGQERRTMRSLGKVTYFGKKGRVRLGTAFADQRGRRSRKRYRTRARGRGAWLSG